ncbi:heme oxygenase [Legionella sp. MW5194]|uniref:biliverdin-producing heme oxygenase n=1 Tax=Legionella sp. MW5194 TaxID=2662448 RepID=UPI00193CBBED|nr:biliverdin-producing heme oxygenase [Legionella sp. MW5194]QRN02591.1 heme oxygenase [Legionella sp. MW5194]
MPKFTEALLAATYKNGKPSGALTDVHAKAEHHRFKKDYLFKDKAIPKGVYASRLIQHYLIIQSLEVHLQALSTEKESAVSAFFILSYLNELWRTPAIEKDLQQLGINPKDIRPSEVAPATTKYLEKIHNASPQALLTHFLVHVAGFMHGGNIILNKYIKPSNELTDYHISTHQYDFSAAFTRLPEKSRSTLGLYQEMMTHLDTRQLSSTDYDEVVNEALCVYEAMTGIYDDLCEMHARQPLVSSSAIAKVGVSLMVVAWVLKWLFDLFNPVANSLPAATP